MKGLWNRLPRWAQEWLAILGLFGVLVLVSVGEKL